jgi:hypothetical protein
LNPISRSVPAVSTLNDYVKSPDAALHGILRHYGVRKSTPHSSGFARLACGAFYAAVESGQFSNFLRVHQRSEK